MTAARLAQCLGRAVMLGGVFVCAASARSGQPEPAGGFRPNILITLIDDLGSDQLEMYDVANGGIHRFFVLDPMTGMLVPNDDHTYAVTPNLDALASTGMRFNWAFTSPTCSPTRAQLFTGRYPHRTGIGGIVNPKGFLDNYPLQGQDPLPDIQQQLDLPLEEVTLPEILGAAGYSTALIGKWHLARDDSHQFGVPAAFNPDPGQMPPPPDIFPNGPPNVPGRAHPALSGWSYFAGIMHNPNNSPNPRDSFFPDSICGQVPTLPGYFCPTNNYYGWIRVESLQSPLPTRDDAIWSAEVISAGNMGSAAYITTVQRHDLDAWISSTASPFFAVWSASASHSPYNQSPTSLVPSPQPCPGGPSIWERYQDLTQALDTEIGNMVATLAALPGRVPPSSLLDETTIIVMGDNGTPINVATIASNSPFPCMASQSRIAPYVANDLTGPVGERFKGSPYLTGTSIPLIVTGYGVAAQSCTPPGLPSGRVESGAIVETVDVFRTILDIAAAPAPAGVLLDGESFAPLLTCGSAPGLESAMSLTYAPNGGFSCALQYDVGFTARIDVNAPGGPQISAQGQEIYRLIRRSNENLNLCSGTAERLYRVFPCGNIQGTGCDLGTLEVTELSSSLPQILQVIRSALDATLQCQGPACFDFCTSFTAWQANCPTHQQL